MMIISALQLKQYHGAHLVLDGITFEIMEGDKVALIGRNGSGKTTLMRLMARISQPDEGQLMLKKIHGSVMSPKYPKEWMTTRCWMYWALVFGNLSLAAPR